MKRFFLLIILFYSSIQAQNVQVDATSYTPQQLVENILINSGCVSNISVTNSVSGNFTDGMKSFGYFDGSGTSFPFEQGIVMSTGRLDNVPGPNNSLSDDNANNWGGDTDLNNTLGINNTLNATILEFDFTPSSSNIRFNYIFASEEYQENNSNTCIYSDVFAFLIKPQGGTYTNIAVIPNTTTPVQVTTVHPEIPGGCAAENESYFGSFNNSNAPINFNGQTAVLTAKADVTPNTVYHIKLIIADEQNYRYDSAVFLEAESFTTSVELGENHTFANQNPLCPNETLLLSPQTNQTITGYQWYKDDVVLSGETNSTYEVTTAGTYKLEATLAAGCNATDEVVVEFSDDIVTNDITLTECDLDGNGLTVYNLTGNDQTLLNNDQNLTITGYYLNETNALNGNGAIANPDTFYNTQPNQTIYVGVSNNYGCVSTAHIILSTIQNPVATAYLSTCTADSNNNGYATFNLSDADNQITNSIATSVNVTYFLSEEDAYLDNNPLTNTFTNTIANNQTLYVRVANNDGCYGISTLELEVFNTPNIPEDSEVIYCTDIYPATKKITSGVQTSPYYSFLWSTGETTQNIHVNQPGNYTVTVTNQYGCSSSRTITVSASSMADLSYTITGTYGNNNVTITANGTGDYIYALDLGDYQEEATFYDLSIGEHTVYVSDTNGCSTSSITFNIINFPNYFTPNNDGVNDYWNVIGDDTSNSTINYIEIFDRYGKPIYSFKPNNIGWDGTYHNIPLPSTDYWFVVHFNNNNNSYQNNFSLLR
ncbi:T9SS C-terminal target domain-containing protein [Neptunitalea chrysea]|uniref:T9SS C-terminal target domain-containing protein n=1 Tax=Neptunitalea chrysea TaxID=1647581 RepID=A0A9W6B9A4_9FLAO|nr:choice-of-anchor L domain-containing protein [Neptunitalea chrysea]GLB53548.1 T9SS C-terminal target domain-containing protein [Neptunitalea chrysea]